MSSAEVRPSKVNCWQVRLVPQDQFPLIHSNHFTSGLTFSCQTRSSVRLSCKTGTLPLRKSKVCFVLFFNEKIVGTKEVWEMERAKQRRKPQKSYWSQSHCPGLSSTRWDSAVSLYSLLRAECWRNFICVIGVPSTPSGLWIRHCCVAEVQTGAGGSQEKFPLHSLDFWVGSGCWKAQRINWGGGRMIAQELRHFPCILLTPIQYPAPDMVYKGVTSKCRARNSP